MSEQTLACREWVIPIIVHIDLLGAWTVDVYRVFVALPDYLVNGLTRDTGIEKTGQLKSARSRESSCG